MFGIKIDRGSQSARVQRVLRDDGYVFRDDGSSPGGPISWGVRYIVVDPSTKTYSLLIRKTPRPHIPRFVADVWLKRQEDTCKTI